MKGVKTNSFFDTFYSLPGWCGVRGSSEVTLKHRKMGQGGSARVYSQALVEANEYTRQRQDRVPRRRAVFPVGGKPGAQAQIARRCLRKETTNAGQQGSKASYWPRRTGST